MAIRRVFCCSHSAKSEDEEEKPLHRKSVHQHYYAVTSNTVYRMHIFFVEFSAFLHNYGETNRKHHSKLLTEGKYYPIRVNYPNSGLLFNSSLFLPTIRTIKKDGMKLVLLMLRPIFGGCRTTFKGLHLQYCNCLLVC